MVESVVLDSRQERFLQIVVQAHVRTAAPVGSRTLSRRPDAGMSPASIRAVFAGLESAGFLYRPHRSSGRVPTDRGYRYYVDRLMTPTPVSEVERRRLRRAAEAGRHAPPRGLDQAIHAVAASVRQLTIGVDARGEPPWVLYAGARHIAEQPEFASSARLAPIFGLLDEPDAIPELFDRMSGEEIAVSIGDENDLEPMRPCSWLRVRIDRGRTVAVLGPTRLDYAGIVARLTELQRLASRSEEGRRDR